MKLFFIYCLLVIAGSSFLTFYRNPDAWHGLVFSIGFYLLALFMIRNGKEASK